MQIKLNKNLTLNETQLSFFMGPCAIESKEICDEVAQYLVSLKEEFNINLIFKASFDKANRSSLNSFRSIGFQNALKVLEHIKTKYKLPVMTDIHECWQVEKLKNIVDIIQIPAFLCRQSDLIISAAKSGLAVNIKKGQFMAGEDMKYVLEKAHSTGNKNVFLTERGNSFGYHNLVVDFRNLSIMKNYAPIVFDITHSVQRPGLGKGKSLGDRHMAIDLAKAAAAIGVSGFFLEIHPHPENAKSDAATMLNFKEAKTCLSQLLKIHATHL